MIQDTEDTSAFSCSRPLDRHSTVQLGHGAGGVMTNQLIDELFARSFRNPILDRRDDSAVLDVDGGRMAFSTDSFVVDPLFFPGGDIGALAVNGTVNDLCMSGATPMWLSAGFIIEEGLALADLERIVRSMSIAATASGVQIVTGDTKVVPHGKADKLFINTAGIGRIGHSYRIDCQNVQPGDCLLVSGFVGDHGIAVMAARERLSLEVPVVSDTAALNSLVAALLATGGGAVHALRDPTRGGVASALNEWACASGVGIRINGGCIPVRPPVRGACELLGLDPLTVANEGVLLAAVAAEQAEGILAVMKQHPLGANASLIGTVDRATSGEVLVRTTLGTWRILDAPSGVLLPRIC